MNVTTFDVLAVLGGFALGWAVGSVVGWSRLFAWVLILGVLPATAGPIVPVNYSPLAKKSIEEALRQRGRGVAGGANPHVGKTYVDANGVTNQVVTPFQNFPNAP